MEAQQTNQKIKKTMKNPKKAKLGCVVQINFKYFSGSCCDASLVGHDFRPEEILLSKVSKGKDHRLEKHNIYVVVGYKNYQYADEILSVINQSEKKAQNHVLFYGSCLFQPDYFFKDANYLQKKLSNLKKKPNVIQLHGCPPQAQDLRDEIDKLIKLIIES